MSNLKDLNKAVSARCREELIRLGIKGVDFVAKTGLSKQTFSAVFNGVTSAPSGFISALCMHYPADVSYIITGVRESDPGDIAAFRKRMDNYIFREYSTQETESDEKEKEMLFMKMILETKDRLIAAQEQLLGYLKEEK